MVAASDVDKVFDAVAARFWIDQPRAWVTREIAKLIEARINDDLLAVASPRSATAPEPSSQSPTTGSLCDREVEDLVARASRACVSSDILQWLRGEWMLSENSSALRVKARVAHVKKNSASASARRRNGPRGASRLSREATGSLAPEAPHRPGHVDTPTPTEHDP
tara:strand:+ start:547 stop:1041 length:495 start_codon:yes stop_codon:yes gene_type:complete